MIDALIVAGAAVAIAVLLRWSTRLRAGERTPAGAARTLSGSALVSPATLIDGAHDIPVALSLNAGRVRYECADLGASIDVRDIDEVKYGSDLMTAGIAGTAILRLRCHGRAFAFVLDIAAAERWSRRLPPHIG